MPEPILSLLIELQRLKRLDRTGWILRGLPNGTESVGAHSFGVSVTAMLLADTIRGEGVDIDTETVLRMSLLHDWAETRVGDMPRIATEYFGADVRKGAELAAFEQIVESADTSDKLYQTLHHQYEQRSSLEAKLVKAADVIDLLVEALALERAGARGLDEFWAVASNADFKLESPAREVVQRVLQALLNARGEISDR